MSRARTTAKILPMTAAPAVQGVTIGKVVGVEAPLLLVEVAGHGVQRARLAVPLSAAQARAAVKARAEVVLVFADGAPVVIGLVQTELAADKQPVEAQVDGKRVVIEGKDEVVLKCGAASLTLRANGKLVIRGAYVESHATGTNRIKGGSVQIN